MPVACEVGINPALASRPVGAVWAGVYAASISFDTFPAQGTNVGAAVHNSGVPNGNFILRAAGIYELSCQIYVEPPVVGSNISLYLGLFDIGPAGTESTLVHVSNMVVPPGMHPSLASSVVVKQASSRYYAWRWYFLDGNSKQQTLSLQTHPVYCKQSVKLLE